MSQLVGFSESEDGMNVVKCALYREKVRVGSLHIHLQEQRLAAIVRTLATKEPTELNGNFTSSDFETRSNHCWMTAQPLGLLVAELPR